MTKLPFVSVIVVNYRTPEYSIQCVQSLVGERIKVPNLEIVLIDNASGDNSVSMMSEGLADLISDGFVELMPLELNGGFGWANNQALLTLMAREKPPEFVMLLNPDCTIEPACIKNLLDELIGYENCAVAGSQLLNPDGSWTGSAFRFPTIGREFVRGSGIGAVGRLLGIAPTLVTSATSCEADWVTGASCLIRTSALASEGLFDDGFFLYFEEVELMFRLRQAGWTIRHVPASRVFHIGGASTGLREGKALSMPSFPLYWFQSRRRFLTLAYGPLKAWMANIAWIAGVTIGRLRSIFDPPKAARTDIADTRQMFNHGLWPDCTDSTRAIARLGDPVGRSPYWMISALQKSHAG
jgi:N-acetylglucosaminyl-diphospho-decaprenol L-rhamnosyltransferase